MKCSEIITLLEQEYGKEYACDWDNVGLLAGRRDKEVKKILLALDATDEVVEQAAEGAYDMLITHHPMIFGAIKRVTDEDMVGRRLLSLIRSDISYYAMHTNFDAAPGCMADLAAERLSLKDTEPLEAMGDMEINGNSVAYGIGKTGNLAEKLTVKALAEKVKQAFDLPFVLVYGEELMDMEVEKVALCPGAGGSVIEEAIHAGAKALVTGDISHHQGIDAAARNMAVIDAGHYGMEHIFIQYMAGYLKENLPVEMEIVTAPSAWPTVLL